MLSACPAFIAWDVHADAQQQAPPHDRSFVQGCLLSKHQPFRMSISTSQTCDAAKYADAERCCFP